jgi:adenylyl- and sulfurtransferase ThiI
MCALKKYKWRNYLVNALLNNIRKNILKFEEDNQVGLLGSYKLCCMESLTQPLIKDLLEIGFDTNKLNSKYYYIAGTMFIIRAKLLKPLQGRYDTNTFRDSSNVSGAHNENAHNIERLFGAIVTLQGFQIITIGNRTLAWLKQNLYVNYITSHGYHLIKICKIPVWRKKVI